MLNYRVMLLYYYIFYEKNDFVLLTTPLKIILYA